MAVAFPPDYPDTAEPSRATARPAGERLLTRTGIELSLRPIHPDDAPALVRAFDRLTREQVRMRLFYTLTALPLKVAQQLCKAYPDRVIAYVVTRPGDGEILAEARIFLDHAAAQAEFAIIVDPDWTGIGVAHALMTRLINDARQRGLAEIWGDVLADNRPMLDLVQRLDFQRVPRSDDRGVIRASLAL